MDGAQNIDPTPEYWNDIFYRNILKAISSLTHMILESMNKKQYPLQIFCDLSKAFIVSTIVFYWKNENIMELFKPLVLGLLHT